MASASPNIIEVTDKDFGTAVLQESYRRPVVVDFWADWCQPCKMIGPVLERLAQEHGGEFLLAKLDVDANPQTSAAFRIQSIPAVKAFIGGRLVNEFIGAIPEQSIRKFVQTLLPTEADMSAMEGEQAEREGRVAEAERLYREALQSDEGHVPAKLGLARLTASRGDLEEAKGMLEPLRPHPEAERLLSAIELSEWASPGKNGDSPVARAQRDAAEGRFDQALETFLQEVQGGGPEADQARDAMLKVFSVLGDQDPLTRDYRRKLSAALF